MRLNMSKFRKIASDKQSSTFQHEDGHKMQVVHKALSPAMRKQIEAMPMHGDKDGGKAADKKSHSPMNPQIKMADGGVAYNADNFSAFESGFNGKKSAPVKREQGANYSVSDTHSPKEGYTNYQAKAFNDKNDHDAKAELTAPAKKKSVDTPDSDDSGPPAKETYSATDKNAYAKGGSVKMADGGWMSEMTEDSGDSGGGGGGMGDMGGLMDMLPLAHGGRVPNVRRYAEGTGDVESDQQGSTPAPVVVNVGGAQPQAPQQPDVPMSQALGHYIGNAVREGVQTTLGAVGRVASPVTNGIKGVAQGLVQGGAGQDLAQVPEMESAMPLPLPADGSQQAPQGQMAPPMGGSPQTPPNSQPQPSNGAMVDPNVMPSQMQAPQQAPQLVKQFDRQQAAEATAYRDSVMAKQAIMDNFQKQMQKLQANREQIMQDYKDEKIDPNHFWESKSTAGQILTAVSMAIGGMGAGLLHQDPLATINHTIDRDIEAQKANLGKKQSLLDYNMKEFQNLEAATAATRAMQMDVVKDKLALAAAANQDPMQKAKLLDMAGTYDRQQQALMQQAAAGKTLSNLNEQIQKNPSVGPAAINALRTIDPKQAEELAGRFVPGMGLALTSKDAMDLKKTTASTDAAKNNIGRLMEISRTPGKAASPQMRAEADSIRLTLQGLLREPILGPGTVNDGERKMLQALIADPTAVFSLDNNTRTRLNTLVKTLDNNLATQAKAAGIPVRQSDGPQLTAQQQVYAKWAQANPNDPRAKLVLEKLGLGK